MGLRAIIGAALVLGSGTVVAFGACQRTTPGPSPPATPPSPATPPVATGPAPPAASSTPSAVSDADRLAAAVAAARACPTPAAEITNRPDGGVVFNNAMTSADAGSIDRGQAVIDALGAQASTFACCFDVGFADGDATELRALLRLELAPDGSVKTARVDPTRSTLAHEVAVACLAAVAAEIRYASSPSDAPTVVEYPLVARVAPSADKQSSKPR